MPGSNIASFGVSARQIANNPVYLLEAYERLYANPICRNQRLVEKRVFFFAFRQKWCRRWELNLWACGPRNRFCGDKTLATSLLIQAQDSRHSFSPKQLRHKCRDLCPPPKWRHTASFVASDRRIADNPVYLLEAYERLYARQWTPIVRLFKFNYPESHRIFPFFLFIINKILY